MKVNPCCWHCALRQHHCSYLLGLKKYATPLNSCIVEPLPFGTFQNRRGLGVSRCQQANGQEKPSFMGHTSLLSHNIAFYALLGVCLKCPNVGLQWKEVPRAVRLQSDSQGVVLIDGIQVCLLSNQMCTWSVKNKQNAVRPKDSICGGTCGLKSLLVTRNKEKKNHRHVSDHTAIQRGFVKVLVMPRQFCRVEVSQQSNTHLLYICSMSLSHTALGPYHYLSAFIPSVYFPQRSVLIFTPIQPSNQTCR